LLYVLRHHPRAQRAIDGAGIHIDEGGKGGLETNELEVGRLVDFGVLEGEDILVVFQLLNGNNILVGESALDMANVEAPKVINTRVDRTIVLEHFQYVLYLVSDMRCIPGHHSSSFVAAISSSTSSSFGEYNDRVSILNPGCLPTK